MFGLHGQDIELIIEAIKRFDEIDYAFIYGSRALGNYKKGSDVDVAITGQRTTPKTATKLSDLLNQEYPLPYFFDVLHYDSITNLKLAQHIDNNGIKIYGNEEMSHESL